MNHSSHDKLGPTGKMEACNLNLKSLLKKIEVNRKDIKITGLNLASTSCSMSTMNFSS